MDDGTNFVDDQIRGLCAVHPLSQIARSDLAPLTPKLERLTVQFAVPSATGEGFVDVESSLDGLRNFIKHRSEIGCRLKALYVASNSKKAILARDMDILNNHVDVVRESSMASYRASLRRWDAAFDTPCFTEWHRELEG